MASNYETFNCVLCGVEVAWYSKGEPETRDWEYERKVCSACAPKERAREQQLANVKSSLRPCIDCGGTTFVCGTLRQFVGEWSRRGDFPVAISKGDRGAGTFYFAACRACGHTTLRVVDPGAIPVDPDHGTHIVEVGSTVPYR
jgi:hypothetical protein